MATGEAAVNTEPIVHRIRAARAAAVMVVEEPDRTLPRAAWALRVERRKTVPQGAREARPAPRELPVRMVRVVVVVVQDRRAGRVVTEETA
jgi:hypothetical protein